MQRIRSAYCVDLNRTVSVGEARMAYFSMDPRPKKFHYLCSHPACQAKGVRIVGANVHKLAKDERYYATPYFRTHPGDLHVAGCPWLGDEEPVKQREGESETDFLQRQARAKLTDFIGLFDPGDNEQGEGGEVSSVAQGGNLAGGLSQAHVGASRGSRQPGHSQTKLLDRLVDTFEESRHLLTREERARLTIQVKGEGTVPLLSYFWHIARCYPGLRNRVIYGGAHLKSYREGFRLTFIDKMDAPDGEGACNVVLYIAPQRMREYRYRGYIQEVIRRDPPYIKVFALGKMTFNPEWRVMEVYIDSLNHLALRSPQ